MRSVRVIAAIVFAAGVAPAGAAADACDGLAARLSALNSSGYGDSDPGLDRSILRQRQLYDQATVAARRAGCLGGLFFAQRNRSPKCGSLLASIDEMKDGLSALNARRRSVSFNPYAAGRERASIMRQMAANRCGGQYVLYNSDGPRRSLFANLFTNDRTPRFDSDGGYDFNASYGNYRTMCIRTCDGYYFPVSFSTPPSRFVDDELACQALCPGAPVTLYVHLNPGETTQQMVSLSGQPYTALPTAYEFRRQFNPACSCQGANVSRILLDPPEPSIITIPYKKDQTAALTPAGPDIGLKPLSPTAEPVEAAVESPAKAVRLVGPPAYFPQ